MIIKPIAYVRLGNMIFKQKLQVNWLLSPFLFIVSSLGLLVGRLGKSWLCIEEI